MTTPVPRDSFFPDLFDFPRDFDQVYSVSERGDRVLAPSFPFSERGVYMEEPTFDIFREATDGDAVWIEAVALLSSARRRMEEIAAATPGRYFVFGQESNSILARVDTQKSVPPLSERKAKSI